MHYTTNYCGLSEDDKRSAAIADIREYLGDDKFVEIVYSIRMMPHIKTNELAMMLDLAGIRGYPVQALHEYALGVAGRRVAICRCPAPVNTEKDCVVGVPTRNVFEFCTGCGNPIHLEACIAMMRAADLEQLHFDVSSRI